MRPDVSFSGREWYEAAERWHTQEHQGCPCCRTRHCVFRSEWGARVEFYCTACDFSASYDPRTGRYLTTAAAGRERPTAVLDRPALPARDFVESN